MTQELKDKWVNALESGTYKQSRYELRTKKDGFDGFCCLGVLVDVIDSTQWEDDHGQMMWKNNICALPSSLRDSLNIDQNKLMGMNDEDGMSFKEIAQYIRENVEVTPEPELA